MGGSTGGRRQAGLLRVARSALEVHRRGGSNGAKGLPGESLKVHGTLKVTLCCAHNTRCKHSDKPWFSWHPAAAEHGQNEQKNKCMVKTERQSMMQHRRMINTIQPEIFIFKSHCQPRPDLSQNNEPEHKNCAEHVGTFLERGDSLVDINLLIYWI